MTAPAYRAHAATRMSSKWPLLSWRRSLEAEGSCRSSDSRELLSMRNQAYFSPSSLLL